MVQQNLVNHFGLLLDKSSSMRERAAELIRVADAQVAHWARKSQEYNQETRVSVYTFADTAQCVVWDMDVLRLPTIGSFYRPDGWTALRDATALAVNDLKMIPEKYGDHAFVIYAFTDGAENRSRNISATALKSLLGGLEENWTVAALVPDFNCKQEAVYHGFPQGNVAVWDMTSDKGVEEAMETVSAATDTFMKSRATGTRSTKNLFGGTAAVNAQTVAATGLKPLDPSTFLIVPVPQVPQGTEISQFVNDAKVNGNGYQLGKVFYELVQRIDRKGHRRGERVQAQKIVAVMERATSKIYMGPQARELVGLPDREVTVHPDANSKYAIFIQSTSTNRHLATGQRLLILK
jgi:hypothetical protein